MTPTVVGKGDGGVVTALAWEARAGGRLRMWPDNETDIDLLGFEFLVDELEVFSPTIVSFP